MIKIGNILDIFILKAFSFGKIEDKIINIIKIPPVNRIKKIKGNQTFPVFNFISKNIVELEIKIVKLIFIGFFEFIIIIRVLIKVRIIISLIIFLSLKKKF